MNRNVLLVDDDTTTLKLLKRLLMSEGFAVDVCESGQDALASLRAGSFDVLITDLVMPGMMGEELVGAARELCPSLRCFIMSGHKALDEPSVATWLEKPIDIAQLVAALDD